MVVTRVVMRSYFLLPLLILQSITVEVDTMAVMFSIFAMPTVSGLMPSSSRRSDAPRNSIGQNPVGIYVSVGQ